MKREDVFLVIGFSTNAYLISGERIALVDPGTPRVVGLAAKIIERSLGRRIEDVGFVIPTHWHVDHVGGLSEVFRRTRADLYASERIAYHLDQGRRIVYPAFSRFINMLRNRPDIKVKLPRLKDIAQINLIGLPLQRGNTFPWKIKGYFKDGDALPGNPDWVVIETPGHTPDSACFWHDKSGTLISGDTILGGSWGAAPNRFVWNDDLYAESLARLKKLDVRRLLPGHGCVVEGKDLLAKL
jgi:glyoxylase-like metal-dependent hydrolase (beta-lactamase superfamily II)